MKTNNTTLEKGQVSLVQAMQEHETEVQKNVPYVRLADGESKKLSLTGNISKTQDNTNPVMTVDGVATDNPAYYASIVQNDLQFGTQPQVYVSNGMPQAPVSTPTFTQSQGAATISLPSGWSVDSAGNLSVNGQQPSLSQSEQFANAYAQYLGWYQATNPNANSAQGKQAFPTTPNWYNQLATNEQGGVYAGNLAALQDASKESPSIYWWDEFGDIAVEYI